MVKRLMLVCAAFASGVALQATPVHASDHLDSPTVIADNRLDIGDLYAWMAPDGQRLNLVMTIVGHTFSDRATYTFHIDSGRAFGRTPATVDLTCRFPSETETDCRLGGVDRARGDSAPETGLASRRQLMRVFTGLRNDPFFNNVRGTRAAYQVAAASVEGGAQADAAACTALAPSASAALMDAWRHTEGGPGRDFLAAWTPRVIVVSVDLRAISRGGRLLAVWASTHVEGKQIDRAARPLTGNALLGTLASPEISNRMKEEWNAEPPRRSARFAPLVAEGLGLYDGFDGVCGNQWLADAAFSDARRYSALSSLLADDRLWINSAVTSCNELFAVERAALGGEPALAADCGGRAPSYDSVNIYRSLLASGRTDSVDDGVHNDDHVHSDTVFPFLAPADATQP